MTNQLDNDRLPLAAQRVAFALRTAGWVCFWVQLGIRNYELRITNLRITNYELRIRN